MKVDLSIVVPVFSGEQYLESLIRSIEDLKIKFEKEFESIRICEAIFVDDESRDSSASIIEKIAGDHDWVRLVTLARNFGQHPATICGVLHSSGDWVVTLDEDLQHPPGQIPKLLAHAIEHSKDIVYAKPQAGPHQVWWRDFMSVNFKRLVGLITSNQHIQKFNSFRLVRGSIARSAAAVTGHDGYFDIVLCWFTGRIDAITMPLVDQRFLEEKKSGYSFRSLLSHARRMLVSSQSKILRGGFFLGLTAFGFSLIFGIRIVIDALFFGLNAEVRGWSSLAVISLFFGGITLLLIGILFEYLSIMVLHHQGKPTFFTVDRRGDVGLRRYVKKLLEL